MKALPFIGNALLVLAVIGIGVMAGMPMGSSIQKDIDKDKTNEKIELYETLNERQEDIILEYKTVSGIEVSSITKTLDNKELIKELDKKIKQLEEEAK